MENTGQPKEVSGGYSRLIREQYEDLDKNLELDLDKNLRKYLIPQTVHGRALEGHGSHFNGQARPDISMGQIFEAIGTDPSEARAKRQEMMQDFLYCTDDLIDGKINRLVDRTGKPIYGIPSLEDFQLEVDKEFFKGGALVGRMDSPLWRERTKQNYKKNLRNVPLRLGYGEELPIDLEKLREHNVLLASFADKPHNLEELTVLQAKGVIIPKGETPSKEFENCFVRYSCGCGICDDAALISIGLLHGPSAMMLGFAIDATDTYTKFCQNKVQGGFDEFIGAHIERRWQEKYNEPLVSDKQTMEIIYLGAKDTLKISGFSSSHRRLIEYEESVRKDRAGKEVKTRQERPTILNHLRFVTHGEAQDFNLGFDRCHSLAFYENMRERFRKTERHNLLPKRVPCQ